MSYLTSWYWDKGDFREKNEDSFSLQQVRLNGIWKGEEAALIIVCDGIGGLPEGETASGFVVQQMTEWFYQDGIGGGRNGCAGMDSGKNGALREGGRNPLRHHLHHGAGAGQTLRAFACGRQPGVPAGKKGTRSDAETQKGERLEEGKCCFYVRTGFVTGLRRGFWRMLLCGSGVIRQRLPEN